MCQGREQNQPQSKWSSSGFEDKYVKRSTVLGQGAFSRVFLGSNSSKSEDVAIKIIERPKLHKEEQDRLMAEVSVLQEISLHRNIVKLHDAYCESLCYRIVLEYMNDGDLLDLMEDQAHNCLDETTVRDVCLSLMSAITHLHKYSIAHRDIKPENVLVASSSSDKLIFKLADFGFAKKEVTPNCLTTMCGSPSYIAPEILTNLKYGVKCDVWSAGVLAFAAMCGYQPFGKKEDIVEGVYDFNNCPGGISKNAKSFVESLLVVDPNNRVTADYTLAHEWFSKGAVLAKSNEPINQKPAIFMIGSQRSGSNWLRTILDQREDLIGPHPPHIMREFLPIIEKFGDLSQDSKFAILVDHVCTFVERNQVPWEDKFGQAIIFCRQTILEQAQASCKRLQLQEEDGLDNELYLLSIFDALMDYFAEANGKELWLCKSMGMSAYHNSLLKFYGQRRLRYIYLVRDPRDVAMSFMNTPVGDKHYYAIAKKWTNLQMRAIKIVENTPDILFLVQYEELLRDRENIITSLFDFIGDRHFGGVKREASVMSIASAAEAIYHAKSGGESVKARRLSQQFENLCRGESFAKDQMEKWKHPENGMSQEDRLIIESVTYEILVYFGYETSIVKSSTDVIKFTEAQLQEFARQNEAGIEKMYHDLKQENPDDYNRRVHQADVLKMEANPITDQQTWSLDSSARAREERKKDFVTKILNQGVVKESTEIGVLDGFGSFLSGAASHQGYYSDSPQKKNQDTFDIRTENGFFGVYDGHGPEGERCSQLCKGLLGDIYEENISDGDTEKVSLQKAHAETHTAIMLSSFINAEISGTATAVVTLKQDLLTAAYAGDSAVIIGTKSDGSSRYLTTPHDLNRPDEVARIERKDGLIMTTEEYDKIKDHLTKKTGTLKACGTNLRGRRPKLGLTHGQTMKDLMKNLTSTVKSIKPSGDSKRIHPDSLSISNHVLRELINEASTHGEISCHQGKGVPRIWSNSSTEKVPGCTFTRSLGDSIAKGIGVSAKPEFKQINVKHDDIIVIATDGVTEYLDPEAVISIVSKIDDPANAAEELVKSAAVQWANKNDYCDDISAIVIFIISDDVIEYA